MFKTFNIKKMFLSLLISFGAGFVGWFFSRNAMSEYANITQPPLSPPGTVFPIVWSILYFLMSLAIYGVSNSHAPQPEKSLCYVLYGLQLVFNATWTILFFTLNFYTFSAVWLGLLIVLIIACIIAFYKTNKPSAYLMLPYLAWCLFALYLNIGVAVLN